MEAFILFIGFGCVIYELGRLTNIIKSLKDNQDNYLL